MGSATQRRLLFTNFKAWHAGLRERIDQKCARHPGDDDRSVGIEMGRAILAFRQIIEPSPILAAVRARIHAGDRRYDLPVLSHRINLDAVGPDVRTRLVRGSM